MYGTLTYKRTRISWSAFRGGQPGGSPAITAYINSSVKAMLSELGLENLDARRRSQRLIMLFKIIHGVVAIEPQDLGLELADTRTRSNHKFKLKLHRSSTKELRHSFVVRTIPEWNLLPANLDSGTHCRLFADDCIVSR